MTERRRYAPVNPEATEKQKCPERMSEEQLSALLSAVGNHEGKALLLSRMRPGVYYDQSELRHLMLDSQSKADGWIMGKSVPFSWCEDSLSHVGAVTKGLSHRGSVDHFAYAKTPYGESVGDSLAGHLLAFSETHPDVSLYQLIGRTGSTAKSKGEIEIDGKTIVEYKKRASLTRLRLFWELATRDQKEMRLTDLAQSLKQTYPDEYPDIITTIAYISKHVIQLSIAGILTYNATQADTSFTYSQLVENRPTGMPKSLKSIGPLLTHQVYEIFCGTQNATLNVQQVYDQLIQRDPLRKGSPERGLKGRIANVLSSLKDQGYLHQGHFDYQKHSDIQMTGEQRQTLADFVFLLDRFSDGDQRFLVQGREIGQAIIDDPTRFTTLLAKAKQVSPEANAQNQSETARELRTVIFEHPHSTTSELRDMYYQSYGRNLTRSSIERIVKGLRDQGTIQVDQKGSAYHYYIPEEEQKGK